MSSIRRQLTLSLLLAVVAAFVLAGWLLLRTVSRQLVDQFDRGLLIQAKALAGLVEQDDEHVEFDYSEEAMPEYAAGAQQPEYFTLWLSDRPASKVSATLDGAELPRRAGALEQPLTWDLSLADGRPGRALGVTLPVRDDEDPEDDDETGPRDGAAGAPSGGDGTLDAVAGGESVVDVLGDAGQGRAPPEPSLPSAQATDPLLLTVVVARSRAELDARLAALVTGLGVAALVVLAVVGFAVTVAVRRGLAPISVLGAEVGRIDAASLSRRVGRAGIPEELLPFADKLDELLARLEADFAKERRMTAAMAHELRTPLAELRAATDVARAWPDDPVLAEDALSTAGEVAVRMGRAVEAILHFCRLEAGQERVAIECVGLAALVDELWAVHERQATVRGILIENELPAGLEVDTDRGLLSLVVGNLLHNAASFASASPIRVAAAAEDSALALVVENPTDQLRPEDLAHVGEPFWRKDSARSDGQHSGLGLTLALSVAAVLGANLRFGLAGGCFRATIVFPAEEAPRRSSVSVAAEPGAGPITEP